MDSLGRHCHTLRPLAHRVHKGYNKQKVAESVCGWDPAKRAPSNQMLSTGGSLRGAPATLIQGFLIILSKIFQITE
uniref:Uncharacterized protein n=1 Tax=Candidatus Kentrum sp. LPFa TaxID=2126335 RepID=A0A450W1M2_9GAMM|nr:MAG: hypothetical protein BECKLPF1236A_GA0070988_1004617 [Candidatus Kentron sp. LPFa]